MKNKSLFAVILVILVAMSGVQPAFAKDDIGSELANVRDATMAYRSIPTAQAAGYNFVPGLDVSFDNLGLAGASYRLINLSLIDTDVNPQKPEALLYTPDPYGMLDFVAVEYLVPMNAWDAAFPGKAPALFGQAFTKNTALGVYLLRVWIWGPMSSGISNGSAPKISYIR